MEIKFILRDLRTQTQLEKSFGENGKRPPSTARYNETQEGAKRHRMTKTVLESQHGTYNVMLRSVTTVAVGNQ